MNVYKGSQCMTSQKIKRETSESQGRVIERFQRYIELTFRTVLHKVILAHVR